MQSTDLGTSSWVMCAGTLPQANFHERLIVAKAAGFHAVSLFPQDYQRALREKVSAKDMRHMLADNDICIAELDPLLDWVPGLPTMGAHEDEFYRMADELGARSINIALAHAQAVDEEKIVAAFSALCGRARAYGLLVTLEFLPWSPVGNIEQALNIVKQANCTNGGLMLDTWHHFRSGLDNAVLQNIPAEKIFSTQLSDAPKKAEDNVINETMQRRRLLGEGDIHFDEIIKTLRAGHCQAPWGVEIFSQELAKLPASDVAKMTAKSMHQLLN